MDLRWATWPQDWSLRHERFRDAVAQLAAGIMQKEKDELVGEIAAMRTRARIITGAVLAAVLIMAAAVAVAIPSWIIANRGAERALATQAEAEAAAAAAEERQAEAKAEARRIAPQAQVTAFEDYWLEALKAELADETDPLFSPDTVSIDVVATIELNSDSLLDFFLHNNTPAWCGSGGCSVEAYLTEDHGRYTKVLDLWSYSHPRSLRFGPYWRLRQKA